MDGVPQLNTGNGEWIRSSDVKTCGGYSVPTLNTYRSKALFVESDGLGGIDKFGQAWRKKAHNGNCWYYEPRIKKRNSEK